MTDQSNQKLIILDRDGVINLDSDEYIKSVDEWIPIESSLRAIAQLNQAGYKVAIATNQSGIGRGYFDHTTLAMMHKKLENELFKFGGHIDAIEFCPDHPENASDRRKPGAGMALDLISQFNADPKQTYFIGDSMSDLQSAVSAGCLPILVLTGKGERTLAKGGLASEVPVFQDLSSFVDSLLQSDPLKLH